MTKISKGCVETVVAEVLAKHVLKGAPAKQMQAIMTAENIKFREIENADEDFVGAILKAKNSTYIVIDKNIDNEGRKNFTTAHELGHHFLNHGLRSCSKSDIPEEGEVKDETEQEANYFASNFLMPIDKVSSAFKAILKTASKGRRQDFLVVEKKTYGYWKIISDDLTKRFKVSVAALKYRLTQLRLIEYAYEN